ncbi:hypothetical protein SUGI_0988540 [Cryptomeria japonica]|nr:hypothetical protein SUGI_0988540 [Cryptomeria japonica]
MAWGPPQAFAIGCGGRKRTFYQEFGCGQACPSSSLGNRGEGYLEKEDPKYQVKQGNGEMKPGEAIKEGKQRLPTRQLQLQRWESYGPLCSGDGVGASADGGKEEGIDGD